MAIKTNKSDVIANFVRYHGRQPNPDELKAGGLIDYLTNKPPQEVETLLSKNSPITKGLIWSDYQKKIAQQETPFEKAYKEAIAKGMTPDQARQAITPEGTQRITTPTTTTPPPTTPTTTTPTETKPPETKPPLIEPVTGLDQVAYDKINNFIDGLGLTQTEKDFLKGTFLNKDIYTSGKTIPTTTQITQWISDAATNAATDISPYYTRISGEELADYKTQLANIRAKSQTFMANEENTYTQKLATTKQQLRARGLTFAGSAIRNIGQQAAVEAPVGYEGTIQAARRLDYEGSQQALTQQAAGISTTAERRLGSAAITGALGEVGALAAPVDLTSLQTSLYTPVGGYGGTGSMASTIDQERAAAIEASRQQRLKQYALSIR